MQCHMKRALRDMLRSRRPACAHARVACKPSLTSHASALHSVADHMWKQWSVHMYSAVTSCHVEVQGVGWPVLTRHSIRIPILCNCAGNEFAACHAVCHAVVRAVLLSREARLGLAAGSDGGAAGLSGQHQPRLGSLPLEGHSNLWQDNSCGVMNGSHFL
jgi:hypothetical protein